MILCSTMLYVQSCKKWDDHVALPQQQLSETLLENLEKDPQMSSFISYARQTGLDSLLSASKNITVFAPTNDALASIPNHIKSDLVLLKKYIQNHISVGAYFLRDAVDSFRVPVLNGKNIFFINKKFDDANIISADIYLSNGVLHKIDKAIEPQQNIWEFINSSKNEYIQNQYISSLTYRVQDPNLAEIDSINPNTGLPVYKPGTGFVTRNTFNTKVYDISNEDSLYTYILLTDNAFNLEKNRLAPYYKSRNSDTADLNAKWGVVKDFSVKGLYNESNLPAMLLSKFGVNIQMNKSSIVSTQKLSNGIVYIMNAASTQLQERIPVVYIEGINPFTFNISNSTPVFYRHRMNPLTGIPFQDIYVNLGTGSGGANRSIGYYTNQLNTTKYKVYMMSVNDKVISGVADGTYGTDSSLNHTVRITSRSNMTDTLFNQSVDITPNTYNEFYLGEFTNDEYNWLFSHPTSLPSGIQYNRHEGTRYIWLISPATATNRPYNLTLNYLRLEPVF